MAIQVERPPVTSDTRDTLQGENYSAQVQNYLKELHANIDYYTNLNYPDAENSINRLQQEKGSAIADIIEYQANPQNPQIAKILVYTHPQEQLYSGSQNRVRVTFLDSPNPKKPFRVGTRLHEIRKPGVIDSSTDAIALIGPDRANPIDTDQNFLTRTLQEAKDASMYQIQAEQGSGEEQQAVKLIEEFFIKRLVDMKQRGLMPDGWRFRVGLLPQTPQYPTPKLKIEVKMDREDILFFLPMPDTNADLRMRIDNAIGTYDFGRFKGQAPSSVEANGSNGSGLVSLTDSTSELTAAQNGIHALPTVDGTTEVVYQSDNGHRLDRKPIVVNTENLDTIVEEIMHLDAQYRDGKDSGTKTPKELRKISKEKTRYLIAFLRARQENLTIKDVLRVGLLTEKNPLFNSSQFTFTFNGREYTTKGLTPDSIFDEDEEPITVELIGEYDYVERKGKPKKSATPPSL